MTSPILRATVALAALLLLSVFSSCERFTQKKNSDSHAGETAAEHAAHSHEGETAEEHAEHSHEGETAEEHAEHSHDGEHHEGDGHDHHEGDSHDHGHDEGGGEAGE